MSLEVHEEASMRLASLHALGAVAPRRCAAPLPVLTHDPW
jgi:hypothetical protein